MTFFNGMQGAGNKLWGAVKSSADTNKDGHSSIWEKAKFGLGFMANPMMTGARVAYNAYQNSHPDIYGSNGKGVSQFYQPYQSQYQYGGNTGGNWYTGVGATPNQASPYSNPSQATTGAVSYNPNVMQTGGGSFDESGGQTRGNGFNFFGAPSMTQGDMNALRMKSEAAGFFDPANRQVTMGGGIGSRFNVLGAHDAMQRRLDMAKYAGSLNPTHDYQDAQFQQELAMKAANMAQ